MLRYAPFAFFGFCLLLFVLSYMAPAPRMGEVANSGVMTYKTLPPLDDGRVTRESQLKIINFFASWCPPCAVEIPLLMRLSEETKSPIIGIAWKDKSDNLRPWLVKHKADFDEIRLDNDGRFGLSHGLRGLPETYVLNDKNEIVYHHRGIVTQQDYEAFAARLKALQP